jgi:hypothetical protein
MRMCHFLKMKCDGVFLWSIHNEYINDKINIYLCDANADLLLGIYAENQNRI